ncbi:MAG: ATPase, T2SS/T4P/T4SS family [Anaerolineae bacterium]
MLNDDSITEILVNTPDCIYVEQRGWLKQVDAAFDDEEHAKRIIDRMVSPLGTRIDAENPIVTARSADGRSFFCTIVPPISRYPIAAIRKYSMRPLRISDLIRFGAMSTETAEFLRALTIAGANLLISGNAGSGKQTLMQTLTEFIPNDLRIITAEGRAELQLYTEHVLALESRAPNVSGKGMITVPNLIDAAIQHRAHWLILGEITMEDAFAYVQAANIADLTTWTLITGYSPSDAIARLESLILMRSPLPAALIRSRVASAVNFVIQQDRLRDGSRKIMAVSEVQGVENGQIKLVDILRFEEVGFENGKVIGRIRPTGVIPNFYRQLFNTGIEIAPETFGVDEARLRAFIGDEHYRLKEEERQRTAAQKEAREREAKREAKRRADGKRRQEKQQKKQAKQTAKAPTSPPKRPSKPGGGGSPFSDDDLDSGFDDLDDFDELSFGSDDLDSFGDISRFDDEDSFG